jgi:hypothetical protein
MPQSVWSIMSPHDVATSRFIQFQCVPITGSMQGPYNGAKKAGDVGTFRCMMHNIQGGRWMGSVAKNILGAIN